MLKPVYALIGEDAFLQLQKIDALLRQLGPDAQRIDSDGEQAELADVFDELRSFAMFGGSKILIMRNADAFLSRFREQLENYVANPSSGSTLVLHSVHCRPTSGFIRPSPRSGGLKSANLLNPMTCRNGS